jgi:hypothetical protein
MQMGQHQQMKIAYPQNQYPQRIPMQNQWHQQVSLSPNKMHNQNQIPDYFQRQPMYGYNNSNTQSYPHLSNMNCPQPNKYSNSPNSNMMSMSSMSMPQSMGQQYYQHNYSHQQQEHNKNYLQEQRRKQQQEEENRQKER